MYDLSRIKSISCADVAEKYGISLTRKHNKLWGKLRNNEKTASFQITPDKNLWYDFGISKGGSVIDLVSELESISTNEAILKLAVDYGIEKDKSYDSSFLTDNQYKELGIEPSRATLNFNFDCSKHSLDDVERWENKYGMPVRELAVKHPKSYENMVEVIGLRTIHKSLSDYNTLLKAYSTIEDHFLKDKNHDTTLKQFYKNIIQETGERVNKLVSLLSKAKLFDNTNYDYLKRDILNDLKNINPQKLPFEHYQYKDNYNSISANYSEDLRFTLLNDKYKSVAYDISDFTSSAKSSLYDLNVFFKSKSTDILLPSDIIDIYLRSSEAIAKFKIDIKKCIAQKNELDNKDPRLVTVNERLKVLNNNLMKASFYYDKSSNVFDELECFKTVSQEEKVKAIDKMKENEKLKPKSNYMEMEM